MAWLTAFLASTALSGPRLFASSFYRKCFQEKPIKTSAVTARAKSKYAIMRYAFVVVFISVFALYSFRGIVFGLPKHSRSYAIFSPLSYESSSERSGNNAPYVTAFSTVPNEAVANKIADDLVSNKLVACVNIIPGLKSVYWWDGKVVRDDELLLMMKTRTELVPNLTKKLNALHPYEVPELIVQPILDGNPDYLSWIGESTTKS